MGPVVCGVLVCKDVSVARPVLLDLVRRARRSGTGKQRHRRRSFDEGRIQDDRQGHGRDSHLQGRGEGLQDKGGLAQG